MAKLIVVENCTLDFVADPNITGGVISILPSSVFSNAINITGNRAFLTINFSITGLTTSTGFVQNATATGSIVGNSSVSKSNSSDIVLEDAVSGIIIVSGLIGQSSATYPVQVEITDPNQTVAKTL